MRLLIFAGFSIILFCLPFLSTGLTDSSDDLFQLDTSSYQLLSSLFHDFSSESSLSDSAEVRNVREFPIGEISDIYRIYTKKQLDAMDQELKQHSHYIYDPIKAQVKVLRQESIKNDKRFAESRDATEYERQFLNVGQRLISLQKLVLRIINSRIENRTTKTSLIGRNFESDLFKQLSELLLGLRVTYLREDTPTEVPTADAQLNWMDMMLRAMKRFGVPDKYVLDRVERMEKILDKVRQIYELNQVATRQNSQINTAFISPYSYEATLRLVNLLGINSGNAIIETKQSSPSDRKPGAFFAPIMVLWRSFINLFSFGNLFGLLTRGIRPAQVQTSSTVAPPKVTRYDSESMRKLIQMLQDNQRLQQQQVGQNKFNNAMKQLIENQNKQQQQINDIIKALVNKTAQSSNHSNQQPGLTGNVSVEVSKSSQQVNTSQIMKDIRDQRKKLNELINELEKPTKINPNGIDSQQNILQVMRKITPMLNTLSRSGFVSNQVVELSRTRLFNILQSLNASNRETIEDSERMRKIGHALDVVLGDIIQDAQKAMT